MTTTFSDTLAVIYPSPSFLCVYLPAPTSAEPSFSRFPNQIIRICSFPLYCPSIFHPSNDLFLFFWFLKLLQALYSHLKIWSSEPLMKEHIRYLFFWAGLFHSVWFFLVLFIYWVRLWRRVKIVNFKKRSLLSTLFPCFFSLKTKQTTTVCMCVCDCVCVSVHVCVHARVRTSPIIF